MSGLPARFRTQARSAETATDAERRIAELERELAETAAELTEARRELLAKSETLRAVLNSRGWRLLNRYRDLRNRVRRLTPGRLWHVGMRLLTLRSLRPVDAEQKLYQRWIERYDKPLDSIIAAKEIRRFAYAPTVSIVMPVYRPALDHLKLAIGSVRAQIYPHWELCVCEDGGGIAEVRDFLEQSRVQDSRIKVTFSAHNRGIGAASNEALRLATGDFVGLLDDDDELAPHALFEVVRFLQKYPDADLIYSDEDKLDAQGTRCEPFFKPGWSPEFLLACMYTCHFSVYRRKLLEEVGGFRSGYDGSQDYDLALRVSEQSARIHHLPKVLYHWRKTTGSAAASPLAKPFARKAAQQALRDHLQRRGLAGEVVDGPWQTHYRVKFAVPANARVSIIIPTRDHLHLLRDCIASIEERTRFGDHEILIVDNESRQPATLRYLAETPHRVIRFPGDFNFSRLINAGVREASGDYLLLLNNDTEVLSPDWITALLEFAQQPEIGVVGARLLYPNGTLQHAGVVVGLGGVAGHPLTGFRADTPHYFGAAGSSRNYSAVTAACMMVRRRVFEDVGGFDERLRAAFNDVDFCLRVRNAGYRIVYTPYAELVHHESASRGYGLDAREVELMHRMWGDTLKTDPYYNPNLSLEHGDFRVRS